MTTTASTPAGRRPAPSAVAVLRRLASATLALLLAAALVAGQLAERGPTPSSGTTVEEPLHLVAAGVEDQVDRALRVARRQKGDAYKYGAEGPDRFDCSGLVWFATHRAGLDSVPRTSAEQGRFMDRIKRKRLQRGDFLFFTGSDGVYHVGIYVGRRDGDRAVLHAPRPGTDVRVEEVWTDSWFAATLRR